MRQPATLLVLVTVSPYPGTAVSPQFEEE
jgi:ureidoacrylate peracid hydrolase